MRSKKTEDNWIYTYYQAIVDGKVCVNEHIRTIYSLILRNLNEKVYFYDHKKATEAVNWIETHCFHTEGVLAPGPLRLELWQKAMVSVIFGIVDGEGRRWFREVFLLVARKNGKSLLAAAIAKYIWYKDGFGTKVYTLAPKLEQADIIYSNIWQMTQLDPEWRQLKEDIANSKDEHNKKTMDDGELARHRQSDLFIPALNATVKKIAFSAKKSDGFNPSLTICDEVASWEGSQGLKQYEVMKSGMGARPEGLLISCSTSGYIDGSIFDELLMRSTKMLQGQSKERRLLPLLYMIEDLDKWNDLNELRKSNPNLGVSVSEDYLLEEIAIAETSLSKKAEFLVKYCNVKQRASVSWLTYQDVAQCFSGKELSFESFKECYCVVGIDLSQTTDLTAAVVLIEKAGKIYGFAQFFMPASKLTEREDKDKVPYAIYEKQGWLRFSGENYVDYQDVVDYVLDLLDKYKIYPLKIGYDRYSSQYMVKTLEAAALQCDDVFQGENLTPIIQETEGLVKDGLFVFGNNELLKQHLLNAALKINSETNRRRLIKVSAYDRIDGMAALLDAVCMRQKWCDEIGHFLKNEGN